MIVFGMMAVKFTFKPLVKHDGQLWECLCVHKMHAPDKSEAAGAEMNGIDAFSEVGRNKL